MSCEVLNWSGPAQRRISPFYEYYVGFSNSSNGVCARRKYTKAATRQFNRC